MDVLNEYGVRDVDEFEWGHVPTHASDGATNPTIDDGTSEQDTQQRDVGSEGQRPAVDGDDTDAEEGTAESSDEWGGTGSVTVAHLGNGDRDEAQRHT